MEDSYRHKGMRRKLVAQIASEGINNQQVLDAMERVPRHFFFDLAFLEKAYKNQAFPIGEGQTISQPFTVAYQSALLEVQKGDKVLEIGTGSGYQACILAELGANVVSIERHKKLYLKAKVLTRAMGYANIRLIFGDGYKGAVNFSPFDKILITAAAPYVPVTLLNQLRVGGILVVPLGEDTQTMTRIRKKNEENYIHEQFGAFRFVPMLKGKAF
ncbi:MAG: protein-L-isoaspartate(D-aspartate) O-methyltransferase [Chitinophagales bacterium]